LLVQSKGINSFILINKQLDTKFRCDTAEKENKFPGILADLFIKIFYLAWVVLFSTFYYITMIHFIPCLEKAINYIFYWFHYLFISDKKIMTKNSKMFPGIIGAPTAGIAIGLLIAPEKGKGYA
jgi:hypothetical protein